jgi:hypothetical protein
MSLTPLWEQCALSLLGMRRTPEATSTIFITITVAKSPKKGSKYFAALYAFERQQPG